MPRAQLLQDTNNPDLLREIDEAVARYRDEKRLEEDDEDEPELADPENSDDDSEPAQLTGRVPRVHRPPIRYSPSTSNHVQCEPEHADFLYYEDELGIELGRIEIVLTEVDYHLLFSDWFTTQPYTSEVPHDDAPSPTTRIHRELLPIS